MRAEEAIQSRFDDAVKINPNEIFESIEQKVRSCFADIIKIDSEEVDMDADLAEVYGIDSIKAIKLVAEVEVEFDIDIPEDKLQNIKSLNNVVALIKQY